MITFIAQLKTPNPNNGAQGNSRIASIIKARDRKHQRDVMRIMTQANVKIPVFPAKVTITRIAPSNGLDPHDGLGAALKGVIDGIADGLGLKNDRDPSVQWILTQKRGRPRYHAVEVSIARAIVDNDCA